MDAETIAEALHELKTKGLYQNEAIELLTEEITSSNELSANHKQELIKLLAKTKDETSIEAIFQILSKYTKLQKAFKKIILNILKD